VQRLWQDLRYATRLLAGSPGFAAMAIFTLALGIGATTAIFSVVNSTLLRPLAYREPQQLYLVREIVPQLAKFYPTLAANIPDFRIWQKRVQSFSGVAIAESTDATLTGRGEPEIVRGVRASADIFNVLGVRPALGRAFRSAEDQPGQGQVLLLTDHFWQNRFQGDPSAIGKSIKLDGIPYEIVGILPSSFRFPPALGGTSSTSRIAFFEPLNGMKSYEQDLIGEFDFAAIARLRPGISEQQATAELNVVQAQIAKEANEGVDLGGVLLPLEAEIVGPARQGLFFLLAGVGAVLLIVCADLASLLLVRVPGRMREAAIRTAMGATRGQLIRQMLSETLLLSFAGGALGMWMGSLAVKWLVHLAPAGIPRLEEIQIDVRVLAFALTMCVLTGMVVGLFPAWRMSRCQPIDTLKSSAAASTENRRTRRMRGTLIGFEIAATTLLLILAGLLMSSLGRLLGVHTGFAKENVLVARVSLPPQTYGDAKDRLHFYQQILLGLRSLPDVRAAGWVSLPPLGGEGSVTGISVPGAARTKSETPVANYRPASPGYFQAMGIPLLQGRIFDPSDQDRKVVVVSQGVAERFWPGKNPIGETCVTHWGSEVPAEVIGVVGDIHTVSLDKPPLLMVYVPNWFNKISVPTFASFVIRTGGTPSAYATPLRDLIRNIDPDVPVVALQPMSEIVSNSVNPRRFPLYLAVSFALSSLLLASLGILGVVGYSIEQRRQEMGIRMALGADLWSLLRMVVRQGMAPVIVGLGVGVVAAIFAGRLISSLLFGVRAYDPLVLVSVAALVSAVALVACYIPARRAMRLDPLVALRYE
jgi:putative ABC transport system permease protein